MKIEIKKTGYNEFSVKLPYETKRRLKQAGLLVVGMAGVAATASTLKKSTPQPTPPERI